MVARRPLPGTQRYQWWWARGIRVYVGRDRAYLVRVRPSGYPIDASHVAIDHAEPDGSRAAIEGEATVMLRRREERRVAGSETAPMCDPMMQQRYPGLWEHLTASTYADGAKREPSSLLVFCQDGALKAMLRDKDAGLCLWVAARGYMALLEALESAIADPETDWREDRAPGGGPAKRTRR